MLASVSGLLAGGGVPISGDGDECASIASRRCLEHPAVLYRGLNVSWKGLVLTSQRSCIESSATPLDGITRNVLLMQLNATDRTAPLAVKTAHGLLYGGAERGRPADAHYHTGESIHAAGAGGAVGDALEELVQARAAGVDGEPEREALESFHRVGRRERARVEHGDAEGCVCGSAVREELGEQREEGLQAS